MSGTLSAVIAHVIWWIGAVAWFLAALYGLSAGGLWALDNLLKRLGLWPAVYQVMRRYCRERRDVRDGRPGQ